MAQRPKVPRTKAAGPVILTAEHYDAMQAALARLGTLEAAMGDAEICDVDCQEYRLARDTFIKKFQAILARKFPNGRPAK